MPIWTPASFAIGENGIWFFSMLWESGVDQPPIEFLDDRNLSPSALALLIDLIGRLSDG